MSEKRVGWFYLLITLIFFVLFIFPTGIFVDESVAVKALDNFGFTNIKILDRDVWFVPLKGGSKEDVVRFTADAINPAGKRVKIYVFSGWLFKSATVRTID
ncbi:MAG: hypothetical protein G01um10143_479 [Parcubacteria group bacterium Gr01-1014_3]|nr:MAG: hypothetical protein G01um10143_479 [Parcubacteria group bacterium Gr01-1014_3]